MKIVDKFNTEKIIEKYKLTLKDVSFCILKEHLVRDNNGQNKLILRNIEFVQNILLQNIGKYNELVNNYSILLTENDVLNLILDKKGIDIKTLLTKTQDDMSLKVLLSILYT